MRAKELIVELNKMPPDAKVGYVYDGAIRGDIAHVWLARSGVVAMADVEDVVYCTEDRPKDAPTKEEDRYWQTEEDQNSELLEG